MSSHVTRSSCNAKDSAGKVCGGRVSTVTVQVDDGKGGRKPATVSRCLTCDTAPCPRCKGRDLNPSAKRCVHCDAPLSPAGGRR